MFLMCVYMWIVEQCHARQISVQTENTFILSYQTAMTYAHRKLHESYSHERVIGVLPCAQGATT